MTAAPILVAGNWETSDSELVSSAPGTGEVIGSTYRASAEQLDRATAAAVATYEHTRRMASYERAGILRRISELVTGNRLDIATTLAREVGKPLADSLVEVDRSAFTFRYAADEAERLTGELLPLDVIASSRGKWALTRRVPLGPIAGISPFNLPLSLAVHKLAPALAAGNTIVLKPDSRAALTLLRLAELMVEAGVPPGAVSMLPMDVEVADRMVTDPRFRLLTFTGSSRVGWDMKSRAGKKNVVLELGGNAAVIIDEDADLDIVMSRLPTGAFKYAGQICISVQRIYVHANHRRELVGRLVDAANALRVGPPLEEGVDIGPMIDEAAAARVIDSIEEAVRGGARVLAGGKRDGAFVYPTVLENVPRQSCLVEEEAFAPVAVVEEFADFDEAVERVNDSPYGLQVGVYTRDLRRIWKAYEDLDVGGVVINDVPTYRVDHMPYGGVKDSGLGREGVKYAIEHMTELRSLILTPEV